MKPHHLTVVPRGEASESAEAVTVSSALLERVGGDRLLLDEVIGLFLEDCPALVETIRQELANGDCEALERAAHSLTGSAGNFDTTEVTGLAKQLEVHARGRDLPASREVFAALEPEVTRLLVRLTATVSTLRCAS